MIVPIVPTQSTKRNEASAVRLALYAHIIEYNECAFWGVNPPGNVDTGCRKVWTKAQRDNIAYYLAEAQEEIEDLIGYFLSPRWVVGTMDEAEREQERLTDNQPIPKGGHMLSRWGMFLEGGVKATETIASGTAVNHATDPAVIGPIAVPTGTTAEEIVVYHPDSEITVSPSSITLSGGNVTIEIPRCRLVTLANADNPSDGLDYDTLSNFESTVDVVRIYNDPSTNAVLVGPNRTSCVCAGYGCGSCTKSACIRVEDERMGHITVRPATYNDGSWTASGSDCCHFSQVRLYYRSGLQQLSRQGREMIVRLAHSKMPEPPCNCDVTSNFWKRDRAMPEVLTRERINCPFGMNDGAWISWRFAMTSRLQRGLMTY